MFALFSSPTAPHDSHHSAFSFHAEFSPHGPLCAGDGSDVADQSAERPLPRLLYSEQLGCLLERESPPGRAGTAYATERTGSPWLQQPAGSGTPAELEFPD
jgi:hypothetical protein